MFLLWTQTFAVFCLRNHNTVYEKLKYIKIKITISSCNHTGQIDFIEDRLRVFYMKSIYIFFYDENFTLFIISLKLIGFDLGQVATKLPLFFFTIVEFLCDLKNQELLQQK